MSDSLLMGQSSLDVFLGESDAKRRRPNPAAALAPVLPIEHKADRDLLEQQQFQIQHQQILIHQQQQQLAGPPKRGEYKCGKCGFFPKKVKHTCMPSEKQKKPSSAVAAAAAAVLVAATTTTNGPAGSGSGGGSGGSGSSGNAMVPSVAKHSSPPMPQLINAASVAPTPSPSSSSSTVPVNGTLTNHVAPHHHSHGHPAIIMLPPHAAPHTYSLSGDMHQIAMPMMQPPSSIGYF